MKRWYVVAAVVLAVPGSSFGQTAAPERSDRAPEQREQRDPHAPGARCHGMSYGTGAQSCGTASGGPVGGLGARN
jgi:hypothetical protein